MSEAALAAAGWGGKVLRLLSHRENEVHEMALPGGGRAALRLHRQGYQSAAAIRSELWWCEALAAAGLPVARPLPVPGGGLAHLLPSGRIASAIGWVEGVPMGRAGEPPEGDTAARCTRLAELGRLVAAVHGASDALALPEGFTRPRWDADGLAGEAPFWGRFWEHPALSAAEAAMLRDTRDFLRARIGAHAAAGGDFGLIHADLLRENVLVGPPGGLTLIDFDDCGFGFRLYDLGTALSQTLDLPDMAALRDALVGGYAAHRPADPGTVDVFTLARCCASVGWTMPRLPPGHPVIRSHIARALACARRVMAQG